MYTLGTLGYAGHIVLNTILLLFACTCGSMYVKVSGSGSEHSLIQK